MNELRVAESCPLIDAIVLQFARLFGGRPPRKPSDLPRGWYELAVELFIDIDRLLDDRAAERFEVLRITERFAAAQRL